MLSTALRGATLGLCLLAAALHAAGHRGTVKFAGLPLPGASVIATQQGKQHYAVTDAEGRYAFDAVAPGAIVVEVSKQLFSTQRRELADVAQAVDWVMELLPRAQFAAKVVQQAATYQRTAVTETAPKQVRQQAPSSTATDPELARQAADGFLINGSVLNANTSPFAQSGAFGNNRRNQRSLYNGSLGMILNNALFDARSYSLTGQNTLKPDYSRIQGLLAFGGPLRIPRLLPRNGPVFTVNYQWTRNRNATTQTGLMPSATERAGFFDSLVRDPLSGMPFPSNQVPASRISPQARRLLDLYPEPNFTGSTNYNFQLPIINGLHQDDLQTRASKGIGRNRLSGNFSLQSTRTDSPDLFHFLDTGRVKGWNAGLGFRRTLSPRSFLNTTFNVNRLTTRTTPYYSHRENVSGEAGIAGNNQEPVNWGPPNLIFANGITPLVSVQASLVRNQTASASADYFVNRGSHNVSAGYTHRRQQFNILSQQDARGTFSFTGAAAGDDFAGFLLGVPDTSAIAFGNADKYLRGQIHEAFINDDWRVHPGLTINAGVRWEYWSPVSEKYGRLVNLAVGSGFSSAVPATTLPRPDRNNIAPRVAVSWRPFAASSIVVRGGYGIYYDTSIYQPIAVEMSQQAPLSRSLRVANSPETPLTLANGFPTTSTDAGATTFSVDPGFRTGYVHTWRVAVQTDLPHALQLSTSYTGSKGTRGQQQVLPNTSPTGVTGPFGFAYLTSNGNSIRNAADLQLRRRLRRGLQAQLQYTWAKMLDNSVLGGRGRSLIAQNWLDLAAERGRSNTDQRHRVEASLQYTTAMNLPRWLREWTAGTQLTWGTGLPLTPLYPLAVPGTGYTGVLRPDYTGAGLYDAPSGLQLNPAALAAPAAGTWGNAGRNSITGPRVFAVSASLGRTLRTWDRFSLDMRIDATNATNTPTFPSWNAVLGHSQFGLPNAVNPMRMAQITMRLGF